MILYDRGEHWFILVFASSDLLRKSIVDSLAAAAVGFLAYVLEAFDLDLAQAVPAIDGSEPFPSFGSETLLDNRIHTVLIVPLSFLLIFRSNQAYGRYWSACPAPPACPVVPARSTAPD